MTTKQRFECALQWFEKNMPVAESELDFQNPFQLLCAVLLSAQCTDKRVNMVTPALFDAFPTAQAMAAATIEEIFPYIRSISYPNAKAKHLWGMAQGLVERFGGEVPDNIDDLQTLPGVGRKTANVVCAVIWNQPTMAVDTHIFRVSERIGLTTRSRSPLQTEQQLLRYIPTDIIPKAHHWLLLHGRYVCKARKPMCEDCGLQTCCRYFAKQVRKQSQLKAEIFPIVNAQGQVIGQAERSVCHSQKTAIDRERYMHPVVHLHVFSSDGRLYLQRRAMHKDLLPGFWDTAVGGHIRYGESIEDALRREVAEEIGVKAFDAQKVESYRFDSERESEIVHIFKTCYDGPFSWNDGEVMDGRFWTFQEIKDALGKHILTPNLEQELHRLGWLK